MSTRFEIPLCVPHLAGNEQAYVADAIARNEVARGEYVERFERLLAEYVGASHAVAVSSGTAALHLALLAAGVGPGDEVILPALTFIATANAVRYCGAEPVFVDVEEDYWQMDPKAVSDLISYGGGYRLWIGHGMQKHGPGTFLRALLPVSLLGHPCELDAFRFMAGSCEMALVHDATEALGAQFDGKPAGALPLFPVKSPRHAAPSLACLSFNANKLITTGGGGMVLMDDPELAGRVRYLANQAKDDAAEYVHREVGYNYRMSNLQAAIGCAQMEHIDEFLATKRRIAETYSRELAGLPGIILPTEAPWARSSWWLYTLRVLEAEYGMTARALRAKLAGEGIEARTLFQPLHLSPAYDVGLSRQSLPVAEQAWREGLSLPSSVGLTEAQQERVIGAIRQRG